MNSDQLATQIRGESVAAVLLEIVFDRSEIGKEAARVNSVATRRSLELLCPLFDQNGCLLIGKEGAGRRRCQVGDDLNMAAPVMLLDSWGRRNQVEDVPLFAFGRSM